MSFAEKIYRHVRIQNIYAYCLINLMMAGMVASYSFTDIKHRLLIVFLTLFSEGYYFTEKPLKWCFLCKNTTKTY